tara:strand:- start:838 stop:1047 length:210 start_codon:yes stop_codon:yes gene_type:complete
MKINKYPVIGEKDYANWNDIDFVCDCKTNAKITDEIYCGKCFEDFRTLDDLDQYDYERNIRIKNGLFKL